VAIFPKRKEKEGFPSARAGGKGEGGIGHQTGRTLRRKATRPREGGGGKKGEKRRKKGGLTPVIKADDTSQLLNPRSSKGKRIVLSSGPEERGKREEVPTYWANPKEKEFWNLSEFVKIQESRRDNAHPSTQKQGGKKKELPGGKRNR